MSVVTAHDIVDINALEPEPAKTEKKKRRKSARLRRLAQSLEKADGLGPAATSLPITPLALHSEKGVISPRSPDGDVDVPLNSSGKLLLAVSWPGLNGAGKNLIVSPRAKEMSPRELNRKLTTAIVDKNLKGTVTTITRDLNDLADDDDEANANQTQQPANGAGRRLSQLIQQQQQPPNGLAASRARSAPAHKSMPVFNRANVDIGSITLVDQHKFLMDERTQKNDIRRISSSSTTTTTSSSADGSSASAEKKDTFVLDRSMEDESSSTLGKGASASEEIGSSSNPSDKSKTIPRRKSERFFSEFKKLALPITSPTVSPHSSPRSRSNTILENNGPLVRVNSYSHSADRSPRSARETVTRVVMGNRDISRDKTVIQLLVDPAGDKLATYVVPNTLIDGKLRNTLTRAAMSNAQPAFRFFTCTEKCVKTDGVCLDHIVDPDAAAKYPIINLLDRKSVPVDYRLPHLQAMFQKDFPMLLGDEWSRFKRENLCTDFSLERVSHIYCIRVFC